LIDVYPVGKIDDNRNLLVRRNGLKDRLKVRTYHGGLAKGESKEEEYGKKREISHNFAPLSGLHPCSKSGHSSESGNPREHSCLPAGDSGSSPE
jgi:hypothetical protein